eukprot:CAMPEP_0197626878 /NCGR_PEP_ID=MMETSP1338-20131121/5655_1 /TAXON_ID=43686 ORGANISM="Pelagodinium beii, Strain RCC1491" /NCGR_SAMPLE_ID=MMETSP1338 /ASSEMBLY_ACC=CAM_ASM_000754 /LENGTH=185 /DNA_ID=CAMNT_0043197461 /DNA_START=343 /DNA_END=901 /DNA_ORIENTATION=-
MRLAEERELGESSEVSHAAERNPGVSLLTHEMVNFLHEAADKPSGTLGRIPADTGARGVRSTLRLPQWRPGSSLTYSLHLDLDVASRARLAGLLGVELGLWSLWRVRGSPARAAQASAWLRRSAEKLRIFSSIPPMLEDLIVPRAVGRGLHSHCNKTKTWRSADTILQGVLGLRLSRTAHTMDCG